MSVGSSKSTSPRRARCRAVAAVANAAAAAKPADIVKERAEREKGHRGWIERYRKPWRGELPPSVKGHAGRAMGGTTLR